MHGADHLASLTGWSGRGMEDTDWTRTKGGLRIAIPPDFRDLAERFPAGTFQGYLDLVPSPLSLADLAKRQLDLLRRERDGPDETDIEEYRLMVELAAAENMEPPPDFLDDRTPIPYPLWPERGGIYPWAMAAEGATFFWLRSDKDPGAWPVVWFHGEDLKWERFDGTATELLIALVTGQIDTRRLGAPIFPPPPRFDQAVVNTLVPRAVQP
jgi:hypothetical protein